MSRPDKPEFKSPTELLSGEGDSAWMKRGLEISSQAGLLQACWSRAAGRIAEHSQLNHIATDNTENGNGVAVVFADSASWASQVRVIATRLCAQLNEELERSGLTDRASSLRVRVQPWQANYDQRTAKTIDSGDSNND